MNVNEAMTTPVKCCTANSNLEEVARLMWEQDCGAIPVVGDDNRPIGIVTDRDIAMSAMLCHAPLWEIPASRVIDGQSLVSCNQGDSIESCVEQMKEACVRRILVTDDSGALCGIVSLGDAVAFTERDPDSEDDTSAVESETLIGMLRRVSAHHPSGDNPLVRIW